MKFIKIPLMIFLASLLSCCEIITDLSEATPEHRLIRKFSAKIKKETGLALDHYGINHSLSRNNKIKNGVANLHVSYTLHRTKKDSMSFEEARSLFVSVAESFIKQVNSNSKVKKDLDIYPFTSDNLDLSIHFLDKNVPYGASPVYFSMSLIEYDGYEGHPGYRLLEYRKYPSGILTEDSRIYRENYDEALEIVKQQSRLIQL